jgi:hypothetical protein
MKSRTTGSLSFIANFAAFGACACLAFMRNSHALFYHYDGSYLLVDAGDQLNFGQPIFEYSNNVLQSIGNIQLPQNARLLFFLWPIGWFANALAAKVASYLIIAGIVFLRLRPRAALSLSRTIARLRMDLVLRPRLCAAAVTKFWPCAPVVIALRRLSPFA